MTKREDDHDPELRDLVRRIEAMDDELDELDDRLEALAAGSLSEPARAALLDEASEDPLLGTAVHVMQPLGPEVYARLVATARSAWAESAEGNGEAEVVSLDARRDARPDTRQRWRPLRVGAPLLLAAAVALSWIGFRQTSALPSYDAAWQSGEQVVRQSAPQARPRFTDGSAIELWLRPDSATEREVRAVVFLDGWEHPIDAAVDVGSSGGVRVHGTLGEPPWAIDEGEHELIVAVGPVDAPVPRGEPGAPWQVSVLSFEVY